MELQQHRKCPAISMPLNGPSGPVLQLQLWKSEVLLKESTQAWPLSAVYSPHKPQHP